MLDNIETGRRGSRVRQRCRCPRLAVKYKHALVITALDPTQLSGANLRLAIARYRERDGDRQRAEGSARRNRVGE